LPRVITLDWLFLNTSNLVYIALNNKINKIVLNKYAKIRKNGKKEEQIFGTKKKLTVFSYSER